MPRSKRSDPFAKREADKYENPIPSREYIFEHLKKRASPATREELYTELALVGDGQQEALRRRLNAMQRDGQLMMNRRGAFGLIDKMNLASGRVQGHKDGYGFFIPDDKSGDLLINHRQMNKVFDGDRVLVRPSEYKYKGRDEAIIVEIIERAHDHIVGRYFEEGGVGFVVPDNVRINQDILVSEENKPKVRQGQIVTVEIVVYPSGRNSAVGKITEVLGEHMAPGMEIDVALRSHGIPFQWGEALTRLLGKIKRTISDTEIAKRVDLRKLPLVTIDGEDARDFDDAVYCERRRGGGWKLYVAIADVSHYVTIGSELDKEAHERGTSVYFPEQVVPMLPEVLSNDLCSLNPYVDRLAMVCEMNFTAKGKMTSYRFCEGVIQSHARLTYTRVSSMLEKAHTAKGKKLREKYEALVPHLETLYDLYKVLRQSREQRGAIDFDSTELRILFGDERKIERIVPVERNEAHKLIEECMLCANVAAADFLDQHNIPGLYRIHEQPSAEKLTNLREFLAELGLSLTGGDKPTAKDYQKLIDQISGRPDAHMIQTVLLRSMMQAVYSPENQGHFGLAYEAYAHFTSPIRRYPDLLVHRAIRSAIRSRRKSDKVLRVDTTTPLPKKQIYPYDASAMAQLGEHCSQAERRADDAVRDVLDWLKCEYAQDHVGESFDGVITSVTAFGLFIELQDVYIEGLLHVSALSNDYYHFDAVKHRLTGERTHFSYRLGDKIRVQVVRVDLDERKIDFELPPEARRATRPAKSGKARKPGKPGKSAKASSKKYKGKRKGK